jgi:hypothetical protein
MHHHLRRVSALAAAGLTAGALTLTTTSAVQAAAVGNTRPTPLAAATQWVLGQSAGGLLPAGAGPTADVALQLGLVGDTADAAQVVAAFTPEVIASYVHATGHDTSAPATSSGAAAKVVAALQAAGVDPATVTAAGDSQDLVSLLASTVDADGRTEDVNGPYGDVASVFTQAYAVHGLQAASAAAPSDPTLATASSKATDFLLTQQCAPGWFSYGFTSTYDSNGLESNSNKSCDADPSRAADPTATAMAIIGLEPQEASRSDVATAIAKAKTWLASQQNADGSWSSVEYLGADFTPTTVESATTTGLAGEALAVTGDVQAAAKAAAFVRSQQIADAGDCARYSSADTGAIVDLSSQLSDAAAGHLAKVSSQVTVSQALAVLKWAPAASGPLTATAPAGYVRAGSTQQVTVTGEAPGSVLCLNGQSWNAAASGRDTRSITVSAGSARYTATDVDGRTAAATIAALGPKTLKVRGAKTLHRHKKATVKVKGLAAGEHVKVTLRGKKVAKGTAKANGVFKAKIKLKGKKLHRLGKAKLKATGQFADIRNGSRTVKVVR